MSNLLYPAAPERVFEEKLQPSPAFRKQATKVVAAILLFLFTYITLLAGAILLAIGCGYAGVWMIIAWPNKLTLLLGAALIFLGLAVLYFLIKFIFARSKDEKPSRKEITEKEQPELFAFIRQLTKDTNTPFPKKIFLSPDVNACVFYHSSFWSMFLPVRKNLEIGLGLVNSVNLSEFKAVMAHEFGHFSQRSMKLGSFTYNANRIIYNMLYDNTGYNNFLSSVGSAHAFLALFANIAVGIATGIQSVLKAVYGVINKSYMALSRQMEYHADTVAASVAGGNNLVTALSRIEMAAGCYEAALDAASEWLTDKKQVSTNIFSNQLSYFKGMALEYDLPVKNELPDITYEFVSSFGSSRINYSEQWASHPTLAQRKANMDDADMNVAPDETSAWQLFCNAALLQEQFTQGIYHGITSEHTTYSTQEFDQWVSKKIEDRQLPAAYKGYYDKRIIDPRETDLAAPSDAPPVNNFDELFNENNRQLWTSITSNQKDMALLKAFQAQDTGIKSFDFDGSKYNIDDCYTIIAQLEVEINTQLARQHQLDQQSFHFFLNHAGTRKEELQATFNQYKEQYIEQENRLQVLENLNKVLRSLIEDEISMAQRVQIKDQLEKEEQVKLKTLLEKLLTQQGSSMDERLTRLSQEFIASQYTYFDEYSGFNREELNTLVRLMNLLRDAWAGQQFAAYKNMLETQLHIYEQQRTGVRV